MDEVLIVEALVDDPPRGALEVVLVAFRAVHFLLHSVEFLGIRVQELPSPFVLELEVLDVHRACFRVVDKQSLKFVAYSLGLFLLEDGRVVYGRKGGVF